MGLVKEITMIEITTRSGVTYQASQDESGRWQASRPGRTPRWKGVASLDALRNAIRWQHKDDGRQGRSS